MGFRSRAVTGALAEETALNFLLSQGLQPLHRNFRRRVGEIDLILADGDVLVFVEVRCRTSSNFTAAALTVDLTKQRKLIRAASLYLARNHQLASRPCRFDVVAIEGCDSQTCHWIPDAFRPHDAAL